MFRPALNMSSLTLETSTMAVAEIDLVTRSLMVIPLDPYEPTPVQISVIQQILLKHGTVIASLVVFIYDYICTLDLEVAYVWSSRRSLATYLFLVNRYLPFVDLVLSLSALQSFLSPQECLHRYSLITWLNVFGITITQIILTLRTIAIWERNRWVTVILGFVFFSTLAMSILGSKLYLDSLIFIPASRAFFFGCVLIDSNKATVINFTSVFFSETVIVILTLIRAQRHLRQSRSSWVHQLYKSGFLFYFYLLAINSLNIIFPIIAPVSLRTNFTDPQRALHSMLCTRVIFFVFSLRNEREGQGNFRRGSGKQTEFSTILDTFAIQERYSAPPVRTFVSSWI
jgi:hypothetical protein